VDDDQTVDESSYSISPPPLGGIAVSDSEKTEALAGSLKNQFQPVNDILCLAVIEMFEVAQRSYFLTSASETNLTNPDEVHEPVRRF